MGVKLAKRIFNDEPLRQELLNEARDGFVSSGMLSWIGNDGRQCNWINSQIRRRSIHLIGDGLPAMPARDWVIASIDTLHAGRLAKEDLVNELKMAWDLHISYDRLYMWFWQEDEVLRCSFAWDWLHRNKKFLLFHRQPVNNYQDLLSFFDETTLSYAEKELCVAAIKKQWSQRRYRENLKGKKQYNFVLSDKSISRLDRLAKKYDLKRTDVLEILLQMEADQGRYLPARMKMLDIE